MQTYEINQNKINQRGGYLNSIILRRMLIDVYYKLSFQQTNMKS